MHSAVMQNKKYIKFAKDNTVEVITLSGIEGGLQKGDRKAARYEVKGRDGKKTLYFAEFPGLTLEDFQGLNRSKAVQYNDTGAIPHTSFVDPFTQKKLAGHRGGTSAKKIMEYAEKALAKIRKTHGKPQLTRRKLELVDKAVAQIDTAVAKSDLRKAFSYLRKIEKSTAKWPELARAPITKAKGRILQSGEKQLDALEDLAQKNPKAAKSKAKVLLGKLKGTELEARAKDLIDGMQ